MACATNTRRNEVKNDTLPHWALAREGIKLIINNNCAEAEQLFLEHPDSLAMYSGYSFAVMMDALMSYEEEKLNKAIQVLRDLEKRCASETGWLRQVTQRVFSFTQVDAKSEQSLADQLETQIILADSQVCIAILTFLQQELSAYLKGGWALRKAWKVYQKVYKDILNLYNEKIGELQLPDPSQNPSPSPTELQNSVEEDRAALSDWDIPDLKIGKNGYSQNHSSSPRFPHSKSANLEPSKNPPSASNTSSTSSGLRKSQSVCNALTNRQNFWSARMDSISRSTSMSFYNISSILSSQDYTLSLLWYHTIVRPFYAIDGTNVQAGVECSERLLKESEAEFSQSALFLFFTGRVCRLNSDIKGALKSYQQAVQNSTQREIKILCTHEVGWCHLIELDYPKAGNSFALLKCSSRWSRSFYNYLAAICAGACEDKEQFQLFKDISQMTLIMPKGTQLDEFLARRAKRCPATIETVIAKKPVYWRLLVFEMLYLWNAIPSCNNENISTIITECKNGQSEEDEPMIGLSKLILGGALCVQRHYDQAEECFKKCLELRKDIPTNADDSHVSAFCLYELGLLLLKKEQTQEEGKNYLRQISQYSHYDFEQKLNVRVHSLLKQA
ncbi:unnamed protein product [Acanthoscelides obtectus]|uniref:Tetratricopeptide repeat protein 39C n=1 Tax=Acanthoscelides obtectus TaxID=200917 RepID=A0A9P0L1K6_ACAOB|nr:unnamed protein product [Acanthoscelides obtectus]CAK1637773.1 Tetratricopeptide repeat protein 39C [Acanthoscelides obtectus]